LYPIDLSGKKGVVFGVANDRSIAWSISKILAQAGVQLAFTYQNDRIKERVVKLASSLNDSLVVPCDVTNDDQISDVFQQVRKSFGNISFVVHCLAFANREDLVGRFSATQREGFRIALDVSAYSLLPVMKHAATLMNDGGSVVTLTFQASQRVYPGYNVMGTAKAALEHEVRQLAAEFGDQNIRVNAISAGPIDTLAARGIDGFLDMKRLHAQKAPLKRNIDVVEVAKTALFLCSDLSSGITGSVIPVDAGYHIMAI
jgi:enoyl-[acyl-carrier protein] reductase I